MRSKRFPLRRAVAALLLTAAWAWPAPAARALYVRAELVNVPVERLTRNLEEAAKKDPKDAKVRFNLARLHAMAYALKTDTAKVRKDKEAEGAWYGYEPKHVPFKAEA